MATTVKEPPSIEGAPAEEGLTFEKVWAALKETERLEKERAERFEREMKERDEKFEREMKERDERFEHEKREAERLEKERDEKFEREKKERDERLDRERQKTERERQKTERAIRALNKQMGGLHNSFGDLAEYMVAPGVVELFNDKGYHITKAATHGYKIFVPGEKRTIRAEIDLYMENGDFIIAVEVKTSLGEKDIEKHKGRLEILREEADKIGDRRKIRGGMAIAVLSKSDRKAILDAGFYLLEPSGDMMKMNLPKGFVPRDW